MLVFGQYFSNFKELLSYIVNERLPNKWKLKFSNFIEYVKFGGNVSDISTFDKTTNKTFQTVRRYIFYLKNLFLHWDTFQSELSNYYESKSKKHTTKISYFLNTKRLLEFFIIPILPWRLWVNYWGVKYVNAVDNRIYVRVKELKKELDNIEFSTDTRKLLNEAFEVRKYAAILRKEKSLNAKGKKKK